MEENGRLRRKDTTKGPPLRILCLDGGGVRGYSMLIILQELMHRTFVEIEGRAPKRHEIPKPCDHFDLIAGTGTGGLIALMLGRLRLDLDTCKDVYVRLTRRAFETDKTFAGIPYKSTMFKASKLEEVIKACVREHTVFEDEGNDLLANATPMSSEVPQSAGPPGSPQSPRAAAAASGMGRSMSQSSRYSQMGVGPMSARMGGSLRWGNANADLYDTRENRTKTAVTAVLKGTKTTTLLRSYDSRKEPAPDVKCAIWQAGRATAAIALAFKPVQIGQSVYLDDGGGTYNPSPLILDEAVQNEWPGREVGVFVSIGTGKRPPGTNNRQHEWWEGFLGGSMGEFAEARRRLINKLEGCEQTHQYMLKDHLIARGVNVENYYRLNVEVGVGEFGMNEWARLSEISTMTRTYLAKRDIENINQNAAVKLAKIQFAKVRHDRAESRRANGQPEGMPRNSWDNPWDRPLPAAPPPPTSNPMAVELPADDMYYQTQPFRPSAQREHERSQSASDEKIAVIPEDAYPPPTGSGPQSPNQRPAQPGYAYNPQQAPTSPQPQQQHYSPVSPSFPHHQPSVSSTGLSPRASVDAPPLPPKTPLPYPDVQQNGYGAPRRGNEGPRTFMNMGELSRGLPYPDVDGPPPVVNTASKPSLPSR